MKVLKSQLDALGLTGVTFDEACQAHADALRAHRFAPVGTPAPSAPNALVEQAVYRVCRGPGQPDDFFYAVEIVDDTPPPRPLAERKAELLAKLAKREQDEGNLVSPAGKRRLWEIERVKVLEKVPAERTPQDNAFLDAMLRRDAYLRDLNVRYATLMSEVEDLTEETIDAWISANGLGGQ
jgi:hypothetical protein